jgi:hypothetical protein
MKINKKNIASFIYDGTDDMLGSFDSETPVPRVHPKFKAQLWLKNGKLVDAPVKWRRLIWAWWIQNRRTEVMNNALIQVKEDMLRSNIPQAYREKHGIKLDYER